MRLSCNDQKLLKILIGVFRKHLFMERPERRAPVLRLCFFQDRYFGGSWMTVPSTEITVQRKSPTNKLTAQLDRSNLCKHEITVTLRP